MIMAQMSFRIDDGLKNDFENLCTDLGMNPTTALTIFIKKMCRENRIPFEITAYNSETLKTLDNARMNRNISRTFNTVDELFDDLDAEN